MKKNLLLALLLLSIGFNAYSQGSVCAIADAFCSDSPFIFPSSTSTTAESGPDYGCLVTQPNPSWYYLGIETNGDIDIQISQVDSSGTPMDVDFIAYGPFSDQATPCTALLTGGCTSDHNCSGNTVDCSFSPDAVENFSITNAQVGEFYIVLITNFIGNTGFITFQQTNVGQANSGATDCSIVCAVETSPDTTLCLNTTHTITTTLGNSSMAASATYEWFKNNAVTPIPGETGNTLTVNSLVATTDTYKVVVNATNCTDPAIDTVIIDYIDSSNLLPNNISSLNICENTNTGFATFDLTQNESAITSNIQNPSDYTISYFTDAGLTNQITNPNSFNNTTQPQTIYISIQNNTTGTCSDNSSFLIRVLYVLATQPSDLSLCDDDSDGFRAFNLSNFNNDVLNGLNTSNYSISYHESQIDADNNDNPLPINYTNTTINTQTIFIRIENNLDSNCFDTTSAQIIVRPLPVINNPINYVQCDDDTDGVTLIDLSEINDHISTETPLTFTYHTSLANANANIEITNSNSFLINSSVQLFCRVTTQYGCFDIAEVNISVSTSQIPTTFLLPDLVQGLLIDELIQCDDLQDDNDDSNGVNTFNLGASISFIRDLFPTNQNIIINFYENENDAILENNVIPDPFHYRNLVPASQDLTLPVTQNIWVRVDNVLDDTCLGLGQHIMLTVNPLPKFNLIYQSQICLDEINTISTDFDNSSGDFTFNWTKDDLVTGSHFLSNDEFIDITEGGTYSLTITNAITSCSRTETIEITESEKPTLVQLEIVTFNKPNNQVIVQVSGDGDYEYTLENTMFYPEYDRDDREFQESSLFNNLNPGEYIVTIRDKNLCGEIKAKFIILDYKPFFTPNGDNLNELWTIKGMELYPISTLTIFNRHGKVLAQLDPNNSGWNGVYKGKIMNDSDYWFRYEYINDQGVRNSQNGHFSLITIK